MRYSSIRKMDISNGEGVGVSLFVQGCHFHCYNCFNQETWDFKGGKAWTDQTKELFFNLINKKYITRISILGGEPLAYENLLDVYDIVKKIKDEFPDKKIWLWTGNELSINDFDSSVNVGWDNGLLKNHILCLCDYVIDGRYMNDLRDLTLLFRGSSNQRIIDVKETIKQGNIVLWEEE